jgi:hypothetical protein
MSDIVSGTGDVLLGPNWMPAEFVNGDHFRWVTNDAVAYVPAVERIEHRVNLEVEAGYSLPHPVALDVFDEDDRLVAQAALDGRQVVQLHLAAGRPKLHGLRLHVQNENRPAAAHDPRILNFRVFSIRAEPLRPDVVSFVDGFRIGRGGWYHLEETGNDTFRWVNNDAEIVVTDAAATTLEIDAERGPGVRSQPLRLAVLGPDGDELARYVLEARQRISIQLPAPAAVPYAITLHADGGGATMPGQPRVLNFRVFHIPAG